MKYAVSLAFLGALLGAGCASQPYPPLPSDVMADHAGGASRGSGSMAVQDSAGGIVGAAQGGEGLVALQQADEQEPEVSFSAPVSQEVDPPPPDPAALGSAEKRQLDIRLAKQRFNYFEDDRLVWSGPISSGTAEHPTPKGDYRVQSKDINKRSGSYTNFFERPTPMPYSLQFTGPYFVHEGYVTGRPESHGCVRLRYQDAKFIYARMRVGDRIVVAD